MKNYILFFCLFCLLTTSCHYLLTVSEDSDYYEIFLFGKEIKETHGLQIVGFGGGFDEGKETFSFTLMGNQTPNLDEARAIFYDVSTRFLERINSSEKLRQSNLNNSFSIGSLSIHIMFPRGPGYINAVGNGHTFDRNSQQPVYFFTYNLESGKPEITYEEPYEQLKSIVEEQRSFQPPN